MRSKLPAQSPYWILGVRAYLHIETVLQHIGCIISHRWKKRPLKRSKWAHEKKHQQQQQQSIQATHNKKSKTQLELRSEEKYRSRWTSNNALCTHTYIYKLLLYMLYIYMRQQNETAKQTTFRFHIHFQSIWIFVSRLNIRKPFLVLICTILLSLDLCYQFYCDQSTDDSVVYSLDMRMFMYLCVCVTGAL